MNQIAGFYWLDFLIFFLVIASMAIGYTQGLLRQVIALAALYIGTVLGAQYYAVVSSWIRAVLFDPTANQFQDAFAFFVILVVVSSIINWLAYDAYRATKLQFSPLVDQLGGVLLGLVTVMIFISIAHPIVAFATTEAWPWGDSVRQYINLGMRYSRVLPIFDALNPALSASVGFWMHTSLPPFFNLTR